MSGANYLQQQPNGMWYYVRRVPRDVADLDPRRVVKRTTKKKQYAQAAIVADRLNQETEDFWSTLGNGVAIDNSIEAYDAAVRRARTMGIRYTSVADLKNGPIDDLIGRVEALDRAGLVGSKLAAQAAFGTIDRPAIKLSQITEAFMSIVGDRMLGKAPDQVRKYRRPRERASKNLIGVIGDKAIGDITRDDALLFREWLFDRVLNDGLEIGSANKDIGHLNGMINELDDHHRLGLKRVFAQTRLRGEKTNQGLSFDPDWVSTRILAPGALANLNVEARVVIYIMCNTGMRPSEIVNLMPDRMHLNSSVPHVEIAADQRQTKTQDSQRSIPLLGIALAGARLIPNGFERYRGKGDNLSATVNKFFGEHDLKQSPRHTLYSLRHTFQDRLIAVEAPERLQAELMGHKFHRPKYGKGPTLEHKAQWLARISFPAPTSSDAL